jgi:Fe-S cluster assembly ATP-binding protein
MLSIKNIHANVEGKQILNGIDLEIKPEKFMPLWDQMVQEKAHWLRYLAGREWV